MKRRTLERHLRAHGCRKLDEGDNHTRWIGPGDGTGKRLREDATEDKPITVAPI